MNTVTAAPERARWPRLTAAPQPRLRSLLPRGYAGFTEATSPRHLVLPASASVSLVVKLADSAHRPPAFVMGPRARHGWWRATAPPLVPGGAADEAGHADQAHLGREFRQFTGTTPTRFLAQIRN